MTKEKMVKEAIKRMKAMNIMGRVIKEFEEGVINKSEGCGILYWLSDEEKEYVKHFEETYGGLVYHVVKVDTEFGMLLNMFYVSKHEEEWCIDEQDIREGYACVYVENLTDDLCSEIGMIAFRSTNGGIVRVG